MGQIYVENPRKIIQNRKEIVQSLNVKNLTIKNNILTFNIDPEKDILATQVFEAINLGFKVRDALVIAEEGNSFKKINIKDITKRNDLARVRGRVIGKQGKALETLESLTNCLISVHDSAIGIIGRTEDIMMADEAIRKLIRGSDHSKVYSSVERLKAEEKQSL